MISVHGSPIAPFGSRETGGMNVYIRQLTAQLARRGYAVDVFTRWADPAQPPIVPLEPGARVIHIPAGEIGPLSKHEVYERLPEFFCGVKRFQQESGLRYDLIHSHYWLSGWVGALLCQRWAVPHAVMFHTLAELKQVSRVGESETPQRAETERRVLATADRIIAATQHERLQMARLYGADPRRVCVVPCGIDLDQFRPGAKARARRRLGFDGERVVLFIGRLEPLKGLDILIRAVARLGDVERLRLVVVGGQPSGDPERARMEALAAELGVAGCISFLGPRPHAELPRFYRAAHVTVVPSLYESFCLVAAESLAAGTPVIATKVGGLRTLVRDGENGFAVPWRTPEAFAERLRQVLEDEPLRRRLAAGARPSVERYGWPAVTSAIEDVYADLLAAGRPSWAALAGN